MSPPIDLLQFDVWETLDEESIQLAHDFWAPLQFDNERFDLGPLGDASNLQPETAEVDWRVPESPEEHKDNIMLHDCMWAGLCVDSEHPTNTFVPSDWTTASPGQSLLRRDTFPMRLETPRPETPPSIDGDEHPQFRHAVDVAGTALRLLRDSAAVAADHTYTFHTTLAQQHYYSLGVQTPSDSGESEEEIDVVSVGTSQQLLAATSHMRPEPVQRRPSVQERHHNQRNVEVAAVRPQVGRKRLVPPSSIPKASVPRRRRGPARRGRSNTETDSESESPDIERRSIHNDMERLRRIGLKNLFDELKRQIPATRDKERAPKVKILQEAAILCRKLREEEIERERLKKQQCKLATKLKKLRLSLSARYRAQRSF